MYRFFVNEKIENEFKLDKDILLHIKSIRLRDGEKFICVFEGKFYICKLNKSNMNASIIELLNEDHEYKNELTLCAAIIKIKNFEILLQKATELGVKNFYPIITNNTNKKYVEQVIRKKERFNSIIKNASEQSFRNKLMTLHEPITFEESLKINIDNKYIAHEIINEKTSIYNAFQGNICFYVGPEGGFDFSEIENAKNENIQVVYLGSRILRAETSSIALLSKIKNDN